jgi:lia operon protein LiaF
MFIGNVRLNLSSAQFLSPNPTVQIIAFISDVDVFVPEGVGLSLTTTCLIGDNKTFGQKHSRFFSSYQFETPGYASAEKKVQIAVLSFIGDTSIKQA